MSQLPRLITDAERANIAAALRGAAAMRRMTATAASNEIASLVKVAPAMKELADPARARKIVDKYMAEAHDLEHLATEILRPGTRLVLERLP